MLVLHLSNAGAVINSMSERGGGTKRPSDPGLFGAPRAGMDRTSLLPWVIAGVAVLLVAALVFFLTRPKGGGPHGLQTADPYSSSIAVTDLQMSESSALSGVKVTYIDGQLRNAGGKTVTGATAQVQFANDEQLPAQLETVPVTVIRTHEPYIDTEPLSTAPLAPGQQREFRLIFENIDSNWNQQLPMIRLTEISTR